MGILTVNRGPGSRLATPSEKRIPISNYLDQQQQDQQQQQDIDTPSGAGTGRSEAYLRGAGLNPHKQQSPSRSGLGSFGGHNNIHNSEWEQESRNSRSVSPKHRSTGQSQSQQQNSNSNLINFLPVPEDRGQIYYSGEDVRYMAALQQFRHSYQTDLLSQRESAATKLATRDDGGVAIDGTTPIFPGTNQISTKSNSQYNQYYGSGTQSAPSPLPNHRILMTPSPGFMPVSEKSYEFFSTLMSVQQNQTSSQNVTPKTPSIVNNYLNNINASTTGGSGAGPPPSLRDKNPGIVGPGNTGNGTTINGHNINSAGVNNNKFNVTNVKVSSDCERDRNSKIRKQTNSSNTITLSPLPCVDPDDYPVDETITYLLQKRN